MTLNIKPIICNSFIMFEKYFGPNQISVFLGKSIKAFTKSHYSFVKHQIGEHFFLFMVIILV